MAEGAQAGSILANRLIDPSGLWDYESEFTTQQTAVQVQSATSSEMHITNIYIVVNGIVDVTLHLLDGTKKWKFYGAAAGNGVFARLRSPIRIAASQNLYVTSSANVTFFLMISGYFRRA